MLSIKNNMMAANAARHLSLNYDSLAKSVERLSSGLRINSAKDDAAGMAVSELVKGDVATLQQGSRNAQDAVSMLQTAEGAMGIIDQNLVRMKELAEQASTDSYSPDQRDIMNQEFQQLANEITRIAESTTFNGISMLNDATTRKINVGSSTTIDVAGAMMNGAALGLTQTKSIDANKNVAATEAAWYTAADGDEFSFHFGAETAIDVNWATAGPIFAGAKTMSQVAADINKTALATAGAEYSPASVVYDSNTGLYTLKLTAKSGGATTLTVTDANTDSAKLKAAAWAETAGTATGLDIGSAGNTTQALNGVTAAIGTKDTYRAKLGYMMNRLESAGQVVDIQAENLLTAESRISDVDVATEVANMTRTNVLAQAGISMLTQANNMPQMALTLLRG
jgi:flagellin